MVSMITSWMYITKAGLDVCFWLPGLILSQESTHNTVDSPMSVKLNRYAKNYKHDHKRSKFKDNGLDHQ